MGKYITIDGRSYYSPCSECKDGYCSSCVIHKYQEDLNTERDRRSSAEWRIEKELEPRIKAEKDRYDRWVSTDTGERACESFSGLIDKLIDFVESSDNKKYMEWEDADGDLEQKILYLIKNRVDDDLYYIGEKDNI
jgi:hypothetical protein